MAGLYTVKRQTEIGSKQWGVYCNGTLVEGGFFDRFYADECAATYEREAAEAEAAHDAYYSTDPAG